MIIHRRLCGLPPPQSQTCPGGREASPSDKNTSSSPICGGKNISSSESCRGTQSNYDNHNTSYNSLENKEVYSSKKCSPNTKNFNQTTKQKYIPQMHTNIYTNKSILYKIFLIYSLFGCCFEFSIAGGVPRFFESNRMVAVLLPGDTEVNTIIYRLRAEDTDRNYPLKFEIESLGINIIYIRRHSCTKSNNIFCEADVFLKNPLETGRLYKFNLRVSDTRGLSTTVKASIQATNGSITPSSTIFIKYPATIEVEEDTPVNKIIGLMTVRKKARSGFGDFQILDEPYGHFRMQPANLVSNQAINGTLILEKQVDFELANLHTFKVCILQPYTNEIIDTRNIACVLVSVVVLDVQDEPPVFIRCKPVTRIKATAVPGDELTTVEAKDGDKENPRQVRYSILPETSIYVPFFKIDNKLGIITINETAMLIRKKMVSLNPILMTVTAEEVTTTQETYPALSSSVEIAFVILDSEFLTPKFIHENYVGEVDEDALSGTNINFQNAFLVKDVKGNFALNIQGDGGAFSVSPSIVKDASDIHIKVKNSFLLDYEKTPQISFKLIARQVQGLNQATSSVDVTIRILDTNDNPPIFSAEPYEVEIYENMKRGTSVLRVHATDKDSGTFGVIRYTDLYGPGSGSLQLESTTGIIQCITDNHSFDRETASEYILTVEAKDNNGQGSSVNIATAKIIIRVKDVNDSPPRFEETIYKGVLAADLRGLREPIRIKASDADADQPNNQIIYDIERSKYSDFFSIGRRTGDLDVRSNFSPKLPAALNAEKTATQKDSGSKMQQALNDNETVISLRVRASDLGDPPLSDWVDVKIFKQEYEERAIRFIYPKPASEVRASQKDLEKTLNVLTGGKTEIIDIQPLNKGILGENTDPTKSDVTALVRFGLNTIIDVERLASQLNSKILNCAAAAQKKEAVVTSLEDSNFSYQTALVFLFVILMLIIITIGICCCCDGCPLYRANRKGTVIGDEGAEGVSYVREDGKNSTPGWWTAMPHFLKNCFLACGYSPPGENRNRMAWSATREKSQYGSVIQLPDRGMVEDRGMEEDRGMVEAMHRNSEALYLEDVNAKIMNRPAMARQPGRGESRLSFLSLEQQPRRVFVIEDSLGGARGKEDLQEENAYLLEEIEDELNGKLPPTGQNVQYSDDLVYDQGNSQVLRLHTNPHGAAFYNTNQRHGGRTGMETEGSGFPQNGGAPGEMVKRFVNGEPSQKYYDSPTHLRLNGIGEESTSLSTNKASFKDRITSKPKSSNQNSLLLQQQLLQQQILLQQQQLQFQSQINQLQTSKGNIVVTTHQMDPLTKQQPRSKDELTAIHGGDITPVQIPNVESFQSDSTAKNGIISTADNISSKEKLGNDENDNVVNNNLNLPDDAKSRLQVSSNDNVSSTENHDININVNQNISSSTIIENNIDNNSSVLNIPWKEKKSNKMLEKKSFFTITYEGMKTDQLRPESASSGC